MSRSEETGNTRTSKVWEEARYRIGLEVMLQVLVLIYQETATPYKQVVIADRFLCFLNHE